MTPEQLKKAIEYAKKNPNDPRAKELRRRIEQGVLNPELEKAGMATTTIKQPKFEPIPEQVPVEPKKSLMDKLGQRYEEGASGVMEQIPKMIGGNPLDKSRVLLRGAGAAGRAVGDVASSIAEGAYGMLPDVITNKVSEVTAPIGEKIAPIASAVMDKYNVFKAKNPEAAQDLEDIVGVSELLGLGAAANLAKTPAKAVLKEVGTAAKSVAPDTTGVAESLIANVNRINPSKRTEFKMQQGKSEEEWLRERGIIGTREQTVKQLSENFQALRQNIDEALDKIPGTHRDPRVTVVADDSAAYAKSIESKEASRMAELAEKAKGVGLTTSEINEVKRFYERNVKTGYLKDGTKSSEQVQLATNRDSGIREALLDIADKNGFPNMREMNKEIQASKFLADEIAGKMEGQGANNMMSITDWIVATPGVALDPSFFAGFALKKLVSTEGARALAARALAGFPEKRPLPRADLEEITRRAQEVLKRQEDLRIETQQAGLLADELQKAGFTMGDGFIMETPIPLTRNEQALIRAAENRAKQQAMVQYILEQRAQGKAVGEGFTIQDIDNVPILNPRDRFDPNKMEADIQFEDKSSFKEGGNPITNNFSQDLPDDKRSSLGLSTQDRGAFGKGTEEVFNDYKDLTTKTLSKLAGRSSVSKQFITDLTNSPDLKQPERDLLREVLTDFDDQINVKEFADKVKTRLLPLSVNSTKPKVVSQADARKELKKQGMAFEKDMDGGGYFVDKSGEIVEYDEVDIATRNLMDAAIGNAETYDQAINPGRYESVNLPDDLRGPVAAYYENIYESPISTSAGGVHFGGDTQNYFAHTRVEDMADGQTRRVIEAQSDLFQKGRLEGEKLSTIKAGLHDPTALEFIREELTPEQFDDYVNNRAYLSSSAKSQILDKIRPGLSDEIKAKVSAVEKAETDARIKELAPLEPYRNTWHERIIREEVKKAAEDGKTKLQFPTGETAMKIEGLGETNTWKVGTSRENVRDLTANDLKVGVSIGRDSHTTNPGALDDVWIITDVLGDGKFKAVPKSNSLTDIDDFRNLDKAAQADYVEQLEETFDISGKVDTENPIYKFYEKEVGKYLKNKYGATLITDPQGVKWWELSVKKEQAKLPIEAFGIIGGVYAGQSLSQ